MTVVEPGVPPLAFLQLLDSGALDPVVVGHFRRIIAQHGTSETDMVMGNLQVPVRWFREAYPGLDVDDATELGFLFAEQAQLTSFGPLSLPLVSAGSAAEVLELLEYLPVISTALHSQFHRHDGGLTVGLSGHTGDAVLDCLVVAYGGFALLRLLDMLAGPLPTVFLTLGWPTRRTRIPLDETLARRVALDGPASFLDVPRDALAAECRFADPVAHRLAVGTLQQRLSEQREPGSFSEKVRRLLEKNPGLGSSRYVADQLAVSTSTLKRRLSEEETTFRDLRQALLKEQAVVRLLDDSLSLNEIARDLGYSDPTNFSHAFKRWTGRAPTEFRRARGKEAG